MTTSTSLRPRVLLAAGASRRRSEVVRLLTEAGYDVHKIDDGAAAADAVGVGVGVGPPSNPPGAAVQGGTDAVLLGLDLSAPTALDICRRLRRRGSPLPLAVLAVHRGRSQPVESLDAGADDHLAPTLNDDELVARVRALVRRSPSSRTVLEVGDLRLDRSRRAVSRNGRPVDLTLTEYAVLELLLRNVDVVLERSAIYEVIWGADLHQSSKALDVHVGGLRRKLEHHGERLIHTVRGVGYVLWSPTGGR